MGDARPAGAPTVLRVVLGKRLHDLREQAGLSFQEAGRALDVTHATIRRMEKAEVGLKVPYVEKLLRIYGVEDPAEVEGFLALTREANRPGWWHRFRDVLPEWFSAFVSLEGEANLIRAYEPHYVPGLLQTEAYARAVLRAGQPHAPDAEIERAVTVRRERQNLLVREKAPLLWVVMDETVLRRPIGGPEVMRAQVDRLIEATALPNVRLQVIPYAAGPHPAMYGPFHIFRFPIEELPDIAYAENLIGASYFDQREDVSAFLEALDRMCAQAAPAHTTKAFLGGIRKEI
ncbi:helix-turn-helix domain-containing protein [Streptomyces mobaraensis NBRC 13819 = DSM 40847]|uniref:Helix-turn-helix domain-containing protein n=2 Tax=Streptomyces mobaraensis TaxID=35621 RepID=A0A5N5W9U1_STRMB|nr:MULTISPECIES: helix-turn-helix transcriptional regulator [Streptomyces]EMF01261.1 helix-turn-helix domain-containing protein [Streptomyces mobaraensis NBRC 13819 = DSM 40847]KAB7846970.1 helix-turn-helix domain-containing protein [Streptomyces mobaraensis]MBC2875627.1 helix-turn-helix domain-containing protein [Streptomyces sp. TYQ1024]QTT76597.1 helix-turn-helix domain-containing protein [Streptomyces mobaraensis NBRC 13819 = DSM 40847]UBI35858.1 helix-turn-helix domain-containing protein 